MEHYSDESGGERPRKERGDYHVGYGKPPPKHRFTKGQSGNPSGRPKKQKTLIEALGEALSRKVEVRIGGKKVKRSLRELTAHRVAAKMADGDLNAIKFGARLDPYFAPLPEDEEGPITFTLHFDEEDPDRFH